MKRSAIKRKPARSAPSKSDKDFWGRLPKRCQCCGYPESVVHHILASADGKTGRRDHRTVVKLCASCHNMGDNSIHMLGSESLFLERTGVDLVAIAVRNREEYDG